MTEIKAIKDRPLEEQVNYAYEHLLSGIRSNDFRGATVDIVNLFLKIGFERGQKEGQ